MNLPDHPNSTLPVRTSDLLATGLGTATVMWIAGYITHIPLIQPYIPTWSVFVVLAVILLLAGYVFGRDSQRGWAVAWIAPLITALVNMLIFASVLEGDSRKQVTIALPGFFAVTLLLMLAGFAVGKTRRRDPSHVHWRLRLALVPVLATALVVSAGGLVTGFDAGFSVKDWPTTEETNMILFPLSKMTGGIYYEHAHRLAGTLVGFTAIVLMIWTWIADRRLWVRLLTTFALLMVIAQGIAGGKWVISGENPYLPYVLFHGSFGQMILATFAVIAAMHAPSWRKLPPLQTPAANTDHWLTVVLLLAFILQTLLGVMVRKSDSGPLMEHMTFAGFVALLVVAVALRGLILYRKKLPPIKRVCHGLLHGTTFQIILGITALIVRQRNQGVHLEPGNPATTSPVDAIITTLHQSVGAFLLMFAALAVAWNWRLLRKGD